MKPTDNRNGINHEWCRPLCPDHTVVRRWSDRGIISDAPALVKLPNGELLCAVEFWSFDGLSGPDTTAFNLYRNNRCVIHSSADCGKTWIERGRLPFVTGKFLVLRELVYFIGSGPEWQGLWISRSADHGRTWDPLRFCARARSTPHQPDGR